MKTTTSEAMPSPTVVLLNWIRIRKPSSSWAIRNSTACVGLIAPLGIGRVRVRATRPSKSRSRMSFTVQPAPRITSAPMANRTTYHRSIQPNPAGLGAITSPHQQG